MANHKELTATLRANIKAAGIAAKCKMMDGDVISVDVPKWGMEFSSDEQRTIRTIAKNMGLTKVRKIEIDVERMTDPYDFKFYI